MRSTFVAAAALSLGSYLISVSTSKAPDANSVQAQLHLHNSPNNVTEKSAISSTFHKVQQTQAAATFSFRSKLLPATNGLVLVKAHQ
jgi:hypothetical protein